MLNSFLDRHYILYVPLYFRDRATFLAPEGFEGDPGVLTLTCPVRCPSAQGFPQNFATTLSTSFTTNRMHSGHALLFPTRGLLEVKNTPPTISFDDNFDVVAWWNAFPDPSNSPANHARTLTINHRRGFPENRLFILQRRSFMIARPSSLQIPHFPHVTSRIRAIPQIALHDDPCSSIQRCPEPRLFVPTQ